MHKQLPILVVDEQWTMRHSVAAALRDIGFSHVLLAVNGLEAIHILQAEPVAAVISDWAMSSLDGIALLRWIRSEPTRAGLPFVLVTAISDPERMRIAIEAGASEYLVKPYTVRDLAGKMQRILSPAFTPTSLEAAAGDQVLGLVNAADVEEKLGGSTVLIVDDVPVNVAMIAMMLKNEYAIETAESGRQALQIAQSKKRPDLILLDVSMPEMDGYAVCRQLKADPATRDIPVIFLTGNDDVSDVVHGLEAGAVDYITKPAVPSILKARIRTQLRLKRAFVDLMQQHSALAAAARLRESVERIAQCDLKNPASAILADTDFLLHEAGLSEKNVKVVQRIQADATRIFDIANTVIFEPQEFPSSVEEAPAPHLFPASQR